MVERGPRNINRVAQQLWPDAGRHKAQSKQCQLRTIHMEFKRGSHAGFDIHYMDQPGAFPHTRLGVTAHYTSSEMTWDGRRSRGLGSFVQLHEYWQAIPWHIKANDLG